jgi:threonine aldolase
MDGARRLNAVAARGEPAAAYCAHVDSAWIDLPKGLGCPMGAVMAGDEEFIARARQTKYLFGGVTHKAGMMAAAAIYALGHHVERLSVDHEHARALGRGLAEIDGVELTQERIEMNIVYFDLASSGLRAPCVLERLSAHGVRMKQIDDTRIRAVTHLDIEKEQMSRAVDAVAAALDGTARA